jgi:hypothetical protein
MPKRQGVMTYDYSETGIETADAPEISSAANVVPHPALERKYASLDLLLSVVTGMTLNEGGIEAVAAFAGWMAGLSAAETKNPDAVLKYMPKVKAALEDQLPFLKDINLSGLRPIFRHDPTPANPYLKVWTDMQALRYGEEHAVMTCHAWQQKKAKIRVRAQGEAAEVWL